MNAPPELASRLRSLKLEMERREPSNGVEMDQSIPGLILYINPRRTTDYPSSNPNKIEIAGNGDCVDETSIQRAISRYASLNISKFFFWHDPLPNHRNFGDLLRRCGLEPFAGTNYPVLAREPARFGATPTELAIRRLSSPVLGCCGGDGAKERFRATVGKEGFDHFAAFCGDSVVATARLFVHAGLAYLCDAGTLEEYRHRGAQTALIAARINRAAELGCALCVTQTLGLLTTSLNNLLRSGFQPSFERSVHQLQPSIGG